MKVAHILAVTLTLASTLTPCFASVVSPTQVQSRYRHVLEKLSVVNRQAMCDSKAQCNGDDSCVNLAGICETTGCNGFCLRLTRCSCDDPCDDGSICISVGKTDNVLLTACLPNLSIELLGDNAPPEVPCDDASNDSNDADGSEESNSSGEGAADSEPGTSPNEEGAEAVCIGIDLLQDFESHELVFKKHALARVLCDTSNSCATKGHMVNYRGKVMMMGTYCNIVGCEQKVMQVNSPKYQRGLKVQSRSEDMHFTALAARYGTRAEEGVLAAAVRAGF